MIWSRLRTREEPPPIRLEIESRDVANEARPADGGVESFDTEGADAINRARLEHLESLGLPLEGKTVLDVGGGPGHLAQFFVERGCRVVSVDARPENIARMHELYPTLEGHVADVEEDDLTRFGRFDVVFCYGLLYHLENPVRALRSIVAACDGLLLLETMVCDTSAAVLRIEDEYLSANQALRGIAHRPSPAWIAMTLDRIGFRNVYAARTPPAHPDYVFEWHDNLYTARDGHLLRGIYVASTSRIDNENLVPLVQVAE
jgi:SAM-dependent methyltransferase